MVQVANPGGNFKTFNGALPCEGTKTLPYNIDFTAANAYLIDLTQQYQQQQFTTLQTIYIDNSDNLDVTEVICGTTNQLITAPPQSQGYYAILEVQPPKLQIQSNGNVIVPVQLLNFYIPPQVWSVTGDANVVAGKLQVADPILDATVSNNRVNVTTNPGAVTNTDNSGTIALGGTAQLLLAANPARKSWKLTNPAGATAETLQFAYGAAGNGKIDIPNGQTWAEGDDGGLVSQQAIYVVAATTGHAFTAYEGT
jgi:predicted secreted protein